MVAASCGGTTDNPARPTTNATTADTSEPTATATAIAGARPSAGCETTGNRVTTTQPATPVEQTSIIEGVERTYLLATPGGQDGAPAPVIVLLHGMGSTAADINRVSDLPARAAEAGMIVVTPQAVGTPTIWRPTAHGPDPASLDQILDDLGRTHCIDKARVHIAGFSVGAALAAAYACARQGDIASIITVTVEAPAGCARPMPILSFHGTSDPVIAYGNHDPAAGAITGTEAHMANWASTAGCGATPTVTEVASEVTRLEWPDCTDGAEVVLYRIIGGGHDWPGPDPATAVGASTQPVSATDEALEFVARHRT
jgi:polyhydroxybutyrate depolymerase